jgi:hypothetical protein
MNHQVIAVGDFCTCRNVSYSLLIFLFAGTGNQIMGLGGPQGGGMVQPSSIPASSCKLTFKYYAKY